MWIPVTSHEIIQASIEIIRTNCEICRKHAIWYEIIRNHNESLEIKENLANYHAKSYEIMKWQMESTDIMWNRANHETKSCKIVWNLNLIFFFFICVYLSFCKQNFKYFSSSLKIFFYGANFVLENDTSRLL